jgi:hypothetical protein
MKWVVLAIVLFIVGYTVVMVKYRKPNAPYRPYQDNVDRATVTRLLSAGYQRSTLQVVRPADPSKSLVLGNGGAAAMLGALGGLPSELDYALVEKPVLAESFASCTAPASVSGGQDYGVLFNAQLPDNDRVITEVMVFRKDKELFLLPVLEKLGGKLQARWRETSVLVSIPTDQFGAGQYRVTLIGSKNSRTWDFSVRQ